MRFLFSILFISLSAFAVNHADIPIAGTSNIYPFDAVKARAVPRAGFAGTDTGWVTVATQALATGSFSGTLPSVDAGWYDISIEIWRNGAPFETVVGAVQKVGVGDVFIVAGQSLVTNTTPTQTTAANEISSKVSLAGVWSAATDPQPSATETDGSFIPSFADQLSTYTQLPVAVLDVGYQGSDVGSWQSGQTHYTNQLGPAVLLFLTKFRGILWEQGQADVILGTGASTYVSRLESVIDSTRSDAGWAIPWFIARSTWGNGGNATIQGAQVTAQGYTGCFAGANTDTLDNTYRYDHVHFTNAGAVSQATLWKNAVVAGFGW